MRQTQTTLLSSMIWQVSDLLRGDFRRAGSAASTVVSQVKTGKINVRSFGETKGTA